MEKNALNMHFQSIDSRVDCMIAFPGISTKELIMRKNYWYATIVCGLATVLLTIFVLILTTVPKVLMGYGILVISGQFLTAFIFLLKPRKIMWLMIIHLYWVMVVTFVFIVRLGGIPYSGGLVFIGFGLAFFTLPMQSTWQTIELISVYLLAVIITTILQPFLPYTPVISERLNFILFAANISWLSITILVYLLHSIRQNIEIEHIETKRLKKNTIIFGALIFGIWGCSKDSLPDPSNPDNGNSTFKKSDVKTFVLKAIKLQNHPTENPMVFWISGNISHMGVIDPSSTVNITGMWPDFQNPGPLDPNGMPTNFSQTCEINMIGADGSSIYFVTSEPAPFSFATGYGEQDWTITSGTGRFEGATGWYKSTSQFDFTTMINYVTGNGEVFITKK